MHMSAQHNKYNNENAFHFNIKIWLRYSQELMMKNIFQHEDVKLAETQFYDYLDDNMVIVLSLTHSHSHTLSLTLSLTPSLSLSLSLLALVWLSNPKPVHMTIRMAKYPSKNLECICMELSLPLIHPLLQ